MAAPTFHAISTRAAGNGSASATAPATSLGDTVLGIVTVASNTADPTGPSGWTMLLAIRHPSSGFGLSVWSKNTVTGTEAGTIYTWSLAGVQMEAAIETCSGAHGIETITSSNKTSTTFAASMNAPNYATTYPNDLNLEFFAMPQSSTITFTAEPATSRLVSQPATSRTGLAVSDQVQATAGTTPTATATSSASSPWVAARISLYSDIPPNAPTLNNPANSASIDLTAANTFTWTFSDPDAGDSQSKFDLQYRVGTGAWTTVTQTTPTQAYTFAANTFALGTTYEWQVRTYDSQGAVGTWSSSSFFTAQNPTPTPTITAPTAGSTINLATSTVTWSAPTQTDYQVRRVADAGGSPNTGVVYSDTGDVVDSSTRSIIVAFPVTGRDEHVEVRVRANGLWSAWADVFVHVNYTTPATPTVTLSADSTQAKITVHHANPAPSGGQPTVTSVDVYRSQDGGATSIRVATGLTPGADWTDFTPASGVSYSYQVIAIGSNGVGAASAWVT